MLIPIGIGLNITARLKNRVRYLELFLKVIRFYMQMVDYEAATVNEICGMLCKTPEFAPLGLTEWSTTRAAPYELEQKLMQGGSLKPPKEDKGLISEFLRGLGTTDMSGQCSHCKLYEELFSEHLQTAKNAVLQKEKLYLSLGVLGGLFVLIILL